MVMGRKDLEEWLCALSAMHEDDDNGPTQHSLENAHTLAAILDDTGAFDMSRGLQAWESGNGTIEVGLRMDADNQFLLEASDWGVSGLVKVNGHSTLLDPNCTAGELHDAVSAFTLKQDGDDDESGDS